MGPSLADCFVRLNVINNPDGWIEWALIASIVVRVIPIIRMRREMLGVRWNSLVTHRNESSGEPLNIDVIGATFMLIVAGECRA